FARMQGDIARAEQLQREAIERLEVAVVLPVDLAIARAELAAILLAAGRRGEAREILTLAMPVLRDVLLPSEVNREAAEASAARLGMVGDTGPLRDPADVLN